ncbi:(2Fe-2S)-binding protein [Pseudonocardia sulfidoxydans NBRC 16205]|uniref:(2Fe-2S)-binding protein n=1 Tax=Pseudonocardia sulfidoxydans NBRC 16205 TaxID=1223511 RepID=A0A511DJU7_9PSEU|nr:(2Fe-2S)-binding protein [Pseudonocardia sulfidoxydans]GEL25081.1 (2Fe-2S)-binding protein [Pseudonocardia sulfidoxydans NBRC 16205]
METKQGTVAVTLTVNGEKRVGVAEPRMLLSDFLRHGLGMTGTHVGCEQGVCGACTVLIDGQPGRSCLAFAVQVEGATVDTVEGMAEPGELSDVQQAFRAEHGLQCGFCTPGFLASTQALLEQNPDPTDDEIREYLSGNVCRCTGYQGIIAAVRRVATERKAASHDA